MQWDSRHSALRKRGHPQNMLASDLSLAKIGDDLGHVFAVLVAVSLMQKIYESTFFLFAKRMDLWFCSIACIGVISVHFGHQTQKPRCSMQLDSFELLQLVFELWKE